MNNEQNYKLENTKKSTLSRYWKLKTDSNMAYDITYYFLRKKVKIWMTYIPSCQSCQEKQLNSDFTIFFRRNLALMILLQWKQFIKNFSWSSFTFTKWKFIQHLLKCATYYISKSLKKDILVQSSAVVNNLYGSQSVNHTSSDIYS